MVNYTYNFGYFDDDLLQKVAIMSDGFEIRESRKKITIINPSDLLVQILDDMDMIPEV